MNGRLAGGGTRNRIVLGVSLAVCAATAVACGDSHGGEDAAIVFDAHFPDTGGPVESNVGQACSTDMDCAEPATTCVTDLPGGYCSEVCVTDDDCPEEAACVQVSRSTSLCLDRCEPAAEDKECREGYGCTSDPSLPNVCLTGCENDSDCAEGLRCDPDGGFRSGGAGECFDPTAALGDPCAERESCGAEQFCVSEDFVELPGGMCVAFGCDLDANAGCPDDGVCLPPLFGRSPWCFDGCATDADCRDQYECRPNLFYPDRLTCQPVFVESNLGQICTAEGTSCQGGFCLSETAYGYPQSYCVAEPCDPTDGDPACPGDGVCVETAAALGLCVDGCASDDDCRDAYACRPSDPEDPDSPTACVPACTTDADCVATPRGSAAYVCNAGTGYCGPPFMEANLGRECTEDGEECVGGRCMSETDEGWPSGMCTYAGCALDGSDPAAACPSGSACTDDGQGDPNRGVCVTACTVEGSGECRAGYECVALTDGGAEGACRPACTAETCTASTSCNDTTGLCE